MRRCFVGLYFERLSHLAVVKRLDERGIVVEIRKLLGRPGGKVFAEDARILSPDPKRDVCARSI